MVNWYSEVDITVKKCAKIDAITRWLQEEYRIDDNIININVDDNKLTIEGDEEDTLSLKGAYKIPSCEEVFTKLSKEFIDSEYDAYASIKNSYSIATNEYFIKYSNKKLKIEMLNTCSMIDLDEYDDYEEFSDDFMCDLSEEEFYKYKESEDILYINESGKVYTEKEYCDSEKEYFSLDLSDTSSENKDDIINKMNEDTVDKIFKALSKSQKKDKDIILKVLETDSSYMDRISEELFKDKKIVYTILKSDSYSWDDLVFKNENIKNDEMLVSIHEKLEKICDEEQEKYDEIFQLELSKEQREQKLKEVERKYRKQYNDCISNIEKSEEFIKWINDDSTL